APSRGRAPVRRRVRHRQPSPDGGGAHRRADRRAGRQRRPGAGLDSPPVPRQRGPELRGVRAAGHAARARGRGERVRGQGAPGPVGRNFAAGMSNGVAYVLDEAGTFTARCNGDMVQVRALEPSDEALVLGLVREHFGATGSTRARMILDSWQRYRDTFRKVVPYTAPVAAEPAAEEEAAGVP